MPNKLSLIAKIIFFNFIGLFAGYFLGHYAQMLAKYIFVDLLGEIRLITSILSWPVEYETYALTGMIFADAAATLLPCALISKFGGAKINYSCILLGILRVATYIYGLIITLSENGFDFSFVWTLIMCLILFVAFTFYTAMNDK